MQKKYAEHSPAPYNHDSHAQLNHLTGKYTDSKYYATSVRKYCITCNFTAIFIL